VTPAPRSGARLATLTSQQADWAGLRVVVAGIGASGFAAADALLERGARVVVADAADGPAQRERAAILDTLGADVRLGPAAAEQVPDVAGQEPDLVVTSPGWRPDHPVLAGAAAAGVPVWSEVELAWRMRPAAGGVGCRLTRPVSPRPGANSRNVFATRSGIGRLGSRIRGVLHRLGGAKETTPCRVNPRPLPTSRATCSSS